MESHASKLKVFTTTLPFPLSTKYPLHSADESSRPELSK